MKAILRSKDLSCPSCINSIEKDLTNKHGVTKAKVYFTTGRVEVEYDPNIISAEQLAEAVGKLGYETKVSVY